MRVEGRIFFRIESIVEVGFTFCCIFLVVFFMEMLGVVGDGGLGRGWLCVSKCCDVVVVKSGGLYLE